MADLGITGIDLLTETSAELPRIRDLGYGRCRLAAAVPNDAPYQAIEDLAGLRVATAHPNTARRFFETQSIPVEVIPISGAVEVAPRLGLAEAIVDLVSTGSTLVDERPPPDRRRPDLRGGPRRRTRRPIASAPRSSTAIDTMLRSVIAARGRKYLMMNAPAAKLAELEALLPGLESPSVIPLAHEGMIAIHSVVGSDEVWGLLPRLKAAGASGHPRAADREDRPVSPADAPVELRLRRLDLRRDRRRQPGRARLP